MLDTRTFIDLGLLDPEVLPAVPELTAITMADLRHGVAMTKDAAARAVRMEVLGAAVADVEPLPFDGAAAARYGTLVALVVGAGRNPKPRRMDLMMAAVASSQGLPLYTRNGAHFAGLEGHVTVVTV
ncbi:type II toxin-antitoxin system VapC family toxin [Streptomyces chumphonensis]